MNIEAKDFPYISSFLSKLPGENNDIWLEEM